jgi:hypothetical protein
MQYEYIIVTNFFNSASGRSIKTVDDTGYSLSVTAKSNIVTANIPAFGSNLAPPVAKLNYLNTWGATNHWGAGIGNDAYQVTWEKKPGVTYEIRYSYTANPEAGILPGTTLVTYRTPVTPTTHAGAFAPYGSHFIPHLPADGTNIKRAEIRAIFTDGFYLPSEPTVLQYTGSVAVQNPAAITGFTAAAQYTDGPNTTSPFASINWNTTDDVESYNLWRAESVGNSITSNWVEITAPQEILPGSRRIRDSGVTLGETYTYLLIANGKLGGKVAAIVRNVAFTNNTIAAFKATTAPALTLTRVDNANGTVRDIRVSWTDVSRGLYSPAGTATYTLFRSPVNRDETGAVTEFNWTQIAMLDLNVPATVNTNTSGNLVFFNDDVRTLETRRVYAYRLVETRTIYGETATNNHSINLTNTAPFIETSNINIFATAPGGLLSPVNSVDITLLSSDYLFDITGTGNGVEIWRRRSDANALPAQSVFTRVTTTPALIQGTAINGYTFTDTSIPITEAFGQYQYKAVVRFNNNELATSIATVTVSPSITGGTVAWSGPNNTTGTITNFLGTRLTNAPVRVRWSVDFGTSWSTPSTPTLTPTPAPPAAQTNFSASFDLPNTTGFYMVQVGFVYNDVFFNLGGYQFTQNIP